jgi:fibronectin type 3 domain-containing protein
MKPLWIIPLLLSLTAWGQDYKVNLTWDAPVSSPDPVVGYNIYRATGSSPTYQLVNSSVNVPTTYSDLTVQDGTSYTYYVVSVDAENNQSVPSNTVTTTIPSGTPPAAITLQLSIQ